ncbi:MAG: glycosyltransferase [Proteobacteria bacterium]|nr:glycosyltransferase [Pseudomonadota bacterium]
MNIVEHGVTRPKTLVFFNSFLFGSIASKRYAYVMRLLCLQQSSIFETYGGIEYYLHDFLSITSEILGPSSVVSFVPKRSENFKLTQTTYEVFPIEYKSQGLLKKLENRLSPALLQAAIKKAKEFRPDIIVVGHISLAPIGLTLSKILGIPFWTIAYGLEVWGGTNLADEFALRGSQKIISISHWTKNILVARGFRESLIEVVHPCLQPGFENKSPKTHSQTEKRPLHLLTVSRLDPQERYKGHDHVLSAMGLIKQLRSEALPHYTIQGHGADRARLEQLVFYGGLQDHVTFLDKLSCREELDELYRSCDVFIIPSQFGCWDGRWRGEGFGIVYVEAGALGIPSIAYDCGGVTDIITSGKDGILVKQNDIEALSHTLLELHDHRERISELGKNARETALTRFSRIAIKSEIEKALGSGQSISEVRPSPNPIDVSHIVDSIS